MANELEPWYARTASTVLTPVIVKVEDPLSGSVFRKVCLTAKPRAELPDIARVSTCVCVEARPSVELPESGRVPIALLIAVKSNDPEPARDKLPKVVLWATKLIAELLARVSAAK